MRGLHQFLSELQSTTSPEAEDACVRRELAHIRSKLQSSPKLDGYQRKKYLAKLMFVHIQGYRVDFGIMEAVSLASSMRDSEKQIVAPVINVLQRDLASLRDSHTCMALHALANIGTLEMAEELGESVLKLLVSATSPPAVVRKAALTLLHLLGKDPQCVNVWEWLDRIVPLIQSRDYGVAQSVVALVTQLAGTSPEACAACFRPAVEQLHHIVTMRPQNERDLYHRVPLPWLQVKLLALLQQLPRPEDSHTKALLLQCLQQLLRSEPLQRAMVDVQETHAQYAVHFEAVHLAMHLDTTSILVARAAVHLGRLFSSEHINVRYIALETMTQLAHTLTSLDPIRMHLDTIVQMLRDRDTSVCRRALDLLYALCEEANVRRIVAHLLDYMPEAEASLRQDMALKVSLLVELVRVHD
ncbi:hypothetical protein MCAP1_001811 [Malassezia caprae]|uniref:Clathrin/coatomer adaptor adaptin-like N-terminal domain-containing protein n=1 Tax=Malassezia caprae TaxID=1381934 RepID=A0AAF0EBF0_9BASI|nr:hypothetical protein MCAP1_001811 [Malassezia caprae]